MYRLSMMNDIVKEYVLEDYGITIVRNDHYYM